MYSKVLITIGIITIVLFFAGIFLSQTSVRSANVTTEGLISEHMELYEQRNGVDSGLSSFIESEEYQRMMDKIDDFDFESASLTNDMIAIQQTLREKCYYWISDEQRFEYRDHCHEGLQPVYDQYDYPEF